MTSILQLLLLIRGIKMEKSNNISYFAIHITHVIVGFLLLSVGIITVLHFDYGNISFLFAVPQFFLTGLVPTLIALLILFRVLTEAEKVSISSKNNTLELNGSWIRKKNRKLKISSIQYIGLKYRETRMKRWIITAVLVVFTIEVHWQNAIDLWGYARIAPILLLCAIILSFAIVLFVFFPRRFIEIGTNEETILIPYRNLSKTKTQQLLEVLNISPDNINREKTIGIITNNIVDGLFSFIFSIFLLIFGIILTITPVIFYGSFTRSIGIILGMKLLLRVINGSPFYYKTENDEIYIGRSIQFTFIKTSKAEVDQRISFSPLRFHYFEIACYIYLIFQATRYSFRNIWYGYTDFSPLYFIIGIVLISLIFIRWFNPLTINKINFKEYSINIRVAKSFELAGKGRLSTKEILTKKMGNFISDFKPFKNDKSLVISFILFILFLIFPWIYILFGGNFIII